MRTLSPSGLCKILKDGGHSVKEIVSEATSIGTCFYAGPQRLISSISTGESLFVEATSEGAQSGYAHEPGLTLLWQLATS